MERNPTRSKNVKVQVANLNQL